MEQGDSAFWGAQGGRVWGDTHARRTEKALPQQGQLSHPLRINDSMPTAEGVLGSGDSRCKGRDRKERSIWGKAGGQ